jgi:hypothetical protein
MHRSIPATSRSSLNTESIGGRCEGRTDCRTSSSQEEGKQEHMREHPSRITQNMMGESQESPNVFFLTRITLAKQPYSQE